MRQIKNSKWLLLGLMILIGIAAGCSSSKNLAKMPPDERLVYAKKLFDKGRYSDAKLQFQILVLNNPGSSFVDMAQFYLAECHFKLKDYLIAANEYEKLINLYPQSEYVDDAQYKIALAYYKLSPKAELDQKYTYKAIEECQKFWEEFPGSEHAPEVAELLQKSREKLAKKQYKTGDLYRRMGYYRSAVLSFDEVLAKFYDTKYAESAYYWKAHCQYRLNDYKEARDTIQALLAKFPKTKYKSKAINMAESIEKKLEKETLQKQMNHSANASLLQ